MSRKEDFGYSAIPSLGLAVYVVYAFSNQGYDNYGRTAFGLIAIIAILAATAQVMLSKDKKNLPFTYINFGIAFGIWTFLIAITFGASLFPWCLLLMELPFKIFLMLAAMALALKLVTKTPKTKH